MKIKFLSPAACLASLCASLLCISAMSEEALFPFVLPWDDAAPGVVNLSGWLPRPAGKSGHVTAGTDGHLYAGKERIRFFGVDLAFSGNIPTHGDAGKIAARMAKFGINIVRFHIMDSRRFPDGILARGANGTRNLDPEALDRLDYFADQLIRNGIYVNMCLLNYRPICAADGLPPEIEKAGGSPFQQRHVVGFFNEKVLDLQKEYARRLLTHRNSYTGRTYAEDPAVAFVEINNENGLIHAWMKKWLDDLPELFLSELRQQWNRWLLQRYATTEKLKQAWAVGEKAVGTEILPNGNFTRQLDGWTLERHAGAEAAAVIAEDAPDSLPAMKSVKISVTKPGTRSWHVRFEQTGITVQKEQTYTLSFLAKADKAAEADVCIEQMHEPWRPLSARKNLSLTAKWQKFHFVLTSTEADTNARVVFDPAMKAGDLWLADVSLKPGGLAGLEPGENVERSAVPLFTKEQFDDRTPAAQRDWIRFLWETEDRYWQTMYDYLKKDLGVKSLVIATASGYSTPNLMAKMDGVDSHAYWQHPVFPGKPWDSENWFVRNETMVDSRGGILPELALRRVLGKPFCVTEYGNPAPNTYASEGHLLRSAYAALQDWDYISASRYSHSDKWNVGCIINYFDINQHPTKMATLIPAAAMYLRGDVKPARQLVVASLDKEREIDLLRFNRNPWEMPSAENAGVQKEEMLIHRVAIATEGCAVPEDALKPEQARATGDRFVSDTGELVWSLQEQKQGVVTVDTDRNKAVIGFGGGKRFELGGVVIEPGPTRQAGWSAITLTAMEGGLLKAPCRLLVTATGVTENTKMVWKNPEKSSVGKNWGEAPTLVEGIPARITLPFPAASVEVWTLDERGQRKESFKAEAGAKGTAVVAIGPDRRTIWYEIVVK